MKKILTILLICLLPLAAGAQTSTKKRSTAAKTATTATVKSSSKASAKSSAQKASTQKTGKKATTKKAAASKGMNGAFIVISKKDLNLRVYSKDSVLLAEYPVCLSKNKGDKQRKGDMKTPESPAGKPFKISAIQDASTWKHDFKDGRGNIKAYGHWFLRLVTPGHSGIGIHGSTNNENSVPGRASEGCIRLRDADIITLKEKYAYVGMPVIIKAENEGLYPWEKK